MKNYFLLIIFLLLFYSIPLESFAINAPNVVINEIAWMGTNIEGVESKNLWRYEWLELHNNTPNIISLDNWKIELYRTDLDFSINLKGNIMANSYFLVASSDKIAKYDLNYSNLGGKFNNSGQKVVLKNNIGEIIDEIDCFSAKKWFAGDNTTKQTMERFGPTDWQNSENPGGTPKTENNTGTADIGQTPAETQQNPPAPIVEPIGSTPTGDSVEIQREGEPPPTYPIGIVFNEILPSPEGPDETEEWLELYNENNFEVDLSGWKVYDTEGKIVNYVFPDNTKIKTEGYLVLIRPKTKIVLNNTGDELTLAQPNGEIADKIAYQKAPKNQSYNRTESGWLWSDMLTKNSKNVISVKSNLADENTTIAKNNVITDKEKLLASLNQTNYKKNNFRDIFLLAIGTVILFTIIFYFLKRKLIK